MALAITYPLAMAAGRDAGNRSMRKAGRIEWNDADYAAAAAVANKLLDLLADPAPLPL